MVRMTACTQDGGKSVIIEPSKRGGTKTHSLACLCACFCSAMFRFFRLLVLYWQERLRAARMRFSIAYIVAGAGCMQLESAHGFVKLDWITHHRQHAFLRSRNPGEWACCTSGGTGCGLSGCSSQVC